jgi:carbon-monoxide dehydrogenase medium subunit
MPMAVAALRGTSRGRVAMKASAFAYVRPTTVAAALAQLGGARDARVLAGGQSLMPSLNMRLAAPDLLVDINRIAELRGIERRSAFVRIGALVRHAEVANSEVVRTHLPLVALAMRHVAHPAIRNRGTTCGSIANADPAAEMPACAVALDASLVLLSRRGRREVPARQFFRGMFETERQDDELLAEVLFPVANPLERFGFDELAVRHGDFAAVGVAARASLENGRIAALDLVVFASEPRPLLSSTAATIAAGQVWSAALGEAIADAAVAEMQPMDNLHGRGATKCKQARILISRVLQRMMHE